MKTLEQKTLEHLNKHTGHLEQPLSDIYFEQLYGRYARYDSDFKIVGHKYNLLEKVQIGEDRYRLKYKFFFLTSNMESSLNALKKEEKKSPESGDDTTSEEDKPDDSGENLDNYCSCDISLTVEEFTGIKGDPMWMYIDNVDDKETRIVLPVFANSLPQYLGVVKKKIKDYQLNENGQKEIMDYFTFKYQTCLSPKCVSEGKRTHYSMLLYGDINDSVNAFADIMIDCFGYKFEKTCRITEKTMMNIYSKGNLEEYFKNKDLIYI